MKNKNHIETVRLETVADESPDMSFLGKYSNSAETEFAIDREERGDCARNEYRYFNPGSVEKFNPAASWIPADVADKHTHWEAAMRSNAEADYKRAESGNAGQWSMVGVIAKAVVRSASGVTQTLRSGGLWGVESDSSKEYLAEVEGNELGALRQELEAFGFSARSIAYAFKNISRASQPAQIPTR